MRVQVEAVVPDFVGQIRNFPFNHIDAQVVAELRAAWNQYPLLRFRDVSIGDREQVAFSKALGPAVIHPRQLQEGRNAEFPEILVVSNKKKDDGSPAGDLGDGELEWHTDTWFVERPPSATILRAIELPASGGNTHFANMYAAYAALPDTLKQRIQGLKIHHQSVIDGRGDVRLGKTMTATDAVAEWPGADHPIVRRHGDSGKLGLYMGAVQKYQSIPGMAPSEAQELLGELWSRATLPDFVWGQVWEPGDMVMWDNRCTMHRRDAFDPTTVRLMHRTTVEGERPMGVA